MKERVTRRTVEADYPGDEVPKEVRDTHEKYGFDKDVIITQEDGTVLLMTKKGYERKHGRT